MLLFWSRHGVKTTIDDTVDFGKRRVGSVRRDIAPCFDSDKGRGIEFVYP